jgi:protoheme IX farnesyltransferase
VGMSGLLYPIASSFLSAGFIYKAWKLKYREEEGDAMRTFIFSIYQLMFLFVALLQTISFVKV